jgi:hypothetical protein
MFQTVFDEVATPVGSNLASSAHICCAPLSETTLCPLLQAGTIRMIELPCGSINEFENALLEIERQSHSARTSKAYKTESFKKP